MLSEADSLDAIGIRADMVDAMSEIEDHHDSDSGWRDIFAQSLASDLSDLLEVNGNITPVGDHEEYEHTVMDILLSSLDGSDFNITSGDSSILYDIASLCAYEGGPGVYHARVLYNTLVPSAYFDDRAICGTSHQEYKLPGDTEFHGHELQIIPNPAQNFINVEYRGHLHPESFRLIATTGLMIGSFEIIQDHHHTYNIADIPDGLYILQAIRDNEIILSQKFVIARQ